MTAVNTEAIFRVRAVASDHWVVYRDTSSEPVASFENKAAALAYALHLARRRARSASPRDFTSSFVGNPSPGRFGRPGDIP